jgi:hypothetical protein
MDNYIHLEQMYYEGDVNDQFISKVAHNVEETCKLADFGFDYVTREYDDGGKIFRKRKYTIDNSNIYGTISHLFLW